MPLTAAFFQISVRIRISTIQIYYYMRKEDGYLEIKVKKDYCEGQNGSGEMGYGSDKKGQDKKRIRERHRENRKAGRQTSECKATLVWTREKERRRLRGKKDNGDGCAR